MKTGGDFDRTLESIDLDAEAVIDETLAELAGIEAELADLAARKRALREVLMHHSEMVPGDALARPLGTIRVLPAYERISYDRRGLDRLSAAMPDVGRLLAGHRRVSTVAPSVRIQWRREG